MQSHSDLDALHRSSANSQKDAPKFIEELKKKAAKMQREGKSKITGGADGEEELASWEHDGVQVRHMPDDEHGILRISAGGGDDTPCPLNYCVIRGDLGKCIALLEKAVKALKAAP